MLTQFCIFKVKYTVGFILFPLANCPRFKFTLANLNVDNGLVALGCSLEKPC